MKFRGLFFTVISIFLTSLYGKSQCPDCIPDMTCGEGANFPTTCPMVLPSGTSGEYYEQVITFYLPANVEADGISATLDEIVISSITGLPFGMEITINDEDNTFYPGEGENYGCATLCGIPLLPGAYDISINVQVTVTAFGFEQVLNESFISPLLIEEGESSNTSFSYDNVAGCGSLDVSYEALIDGDPYPTEYSWDFGNGEVSELASPEAQTYNTPGTYTASLQTTIYQYVLTTVIVSSVSTNGDGDIDELFGALAPDPYIIILNENGSAVYTSESVDGSDSAVFDALSVIIVEPGYTIQVWDSDTLSEDDLLGEQVLGNSEEGISVLSDGGTQGSFTIELQINSQFIDEQTVTVFDIPNPTLSYDEDASVLTVVDETAVSFEWTLNGEIIVDEITESILLAAPGVYQCTVANEFGCAAITEEFILCPLIAIQSAGDLLFVVGGYASYTWFYNGLELAGEIGNSIPFQGIGNYAVEITTDYGCEVESEVLSIETGVFELRTPLTMELEVFPNPVVDFMYTNILGITNGQLTVKLFSTEGRLVRSELRSLSEEAVLKLDVSSLSAGTYVITITDSKDLSTSAVFMK